MSVEYFGAGPINEKLSRFWSILLLNGIYVEFNHNDNVGSIKALHRLLLQFGQMPNEETQHSKSNEESRKFRLEGNKLFAKPSNLSDALELYNKSICWAEQENGEDFALGFANRSAVYYEWKLYEICIENINLAVEAGYPQRLMTKLDQRRADCIKRMQEAIGEEDRIASNVCPKPLTLHIGQKLLKMTSDQRRRWQSNRYICDVQHHRSEPKLSFKPNPQVPFIANCLEMKSNPQQGRYIITKEDLKPGQIISIEDPYVNSLTKEYRYRKCANCFKENFLSLIPCSSCTCTMFCSKKCLTESAVSEKGFHRFECPIAEYIWTQCEEFALTLRLVVKVFTIFDSIQELIEFREKNKKTNITVFSFDYRNGLNDKERYSQIDNLLTNEKKRIEYDLFTRCCKVAILYHQLIEKTKLGGMLQTQLDRDTLISVIMQHTQVTSINCFNCYQCDDVDIDAFKEFIEMNIFSRAMYPFSSLFNHSCAPNISTIFAGTKMVTYVTRPIKRNSEVLGCYKRYTHFEQDKFSRTSVLPTMYHFVCKCEACENDFPMWHEERMPLGDITTEIFALSDTIISNLDIELNQFDKFCSILEKYSSHYPCFSLYNIGLKLHRALILKFGNLSTELEVTLNDNNSKLVSALHQ